MNEPRICKHCHHAILSTSHANAKYCSRECFNEAQRKSHLRAQALRYGKPQSVAKPETFTVGQRVRVPTETQRVIGGQCVTVTGVDIGTISAVGTVILVNVHTGGNNVTREFTPEQLRGAAVPEVVHRFGYPTPAGGGQ